MPKPPSQIVVNWKGGTIYDAGRPDRPAVRLDTSGVTGPGPVDTLMCALCTCTAEDVLSILEKRRTPVTALRIEGKGIRADAVPARIVSIQITYHVDGETVEPDQAKRAAQLAVDKYCSVRTSLNPDIPVEVIVMVNGSAA